MATAHPVLSNLPREASVVIEPGGPSRHYWKEVWRCRDAALALAWRNVAVLYKQTLLGLAWLVIRPLVTMLLFSFIFGRVAHLPADGGAPYSLLVMTGLLAWQFFSSTVSETAQSLVINPQMVSKIYFPRLLLPLSALSVPLLDLLVSALMLGGLMIWHGYAPGLHLLWLPAVLFVLALLALGTGILLAAVNAYFRDVRYAIPFLLQAGLYLSPVGYSVAMIPPEYAGLYSLNPLVGIIQAMRWCVLGGNVPLDGLAGAVSVLAAVIMMVTGLTVFRRLERRLADVI